MSRSIEQLDHLMTYSTGILDLRSYTFQREHDSLYSLLIVSRHNNPYFMTVLNHSYVITGLSWVKLELIYFLLFGFLVFIGACLAASNNSTGNPALNAGAVRYISNFDCSREIWQRTLLKSFFRPWAMWFNHMELEARLRVWHDVLDLYNGSQGALNSKPRPIVSMAYALWSHTHRINDLLFSGRSRGKIHPCHEAQDRRSMGFKLPISFFRRLDF